jgi:adenosyl cobinamide kinase/adenosyl cobinamide phosphate guanylyltransferase
MSSTTNQLINQIRQATASATSSVMGHVYDQQMLQQLTESSELRQQIAAAATDDPATLHSLILEQLIKPANQQDEARREQLVKQVEDALEKLQNHTTAITSSTGAGVMLKAVNAKAEFEDSLKTVTQIVSRMNTTERRIDKINVQVNALCYKDDDDDDADEDADDDTTKRITDLQTRREQMTKEVKQLQQQLFNHFDETLGGLSTLSKQDKKPLNLPKNLDKVTTRQMTDAIKGYMSHRATEYYAILPYIKINTQPTATTHIQARTKSLRAGRSNTTRCQSA